LVGRRRTEKRKKGSVSRDEIWQFILVAGYLIIFEIVLSRFPTFICEEVVSSTSLVYVTVEGVHASLEFRDQDRLSQAAGRHLRDCGGSDVDVDSVANLQSIQFSFLSTDIVTILFQIGGGFFVLTIFTFAEGVLLEDRFIERDRLRILKEEP
jgi:hypothetical protein